MKPKTGNSQPRKLSTGVAIALNRIGFTQGKFCIIAETPANKGLGTLQMSVAQYGYPRVSTDDHTPARNARH
jgi:hypothetical protein